MERIKPTEIAIMLFLAGIAITAYGTWKGYNEQEVLRARIATLEADVGYWSGLAESESLRADENDYELRELQRWSADCFCPDKRATPPDPPAPLQVQSCQPPVPGRTYTVTEDTWATVRDPHERVAQAVLLTGGTISVLRLDTSDPYDDRVVVDYTLPQDEEAGGTLAPSGRALLSVNRFCDATVGSAEAQRQVKLLEAP